jgi:hypothetical protein
VSNYIYISDAELILAAIAILNLFLLIINVMLIWRYLIATKKLVGESWRQSDMMTRQFIPNVQLILKMIEKPAHLKYDCIVFQENNIHTIIDINNISKSISKFELLVKGITMITTEGDKFYPLESKINDQLFILFPGETLSYPAYININNEIFDFIRNNIKNPKLRLYFNINIKYIDKSNDIIDKWLFVVTGAYITDTDIYYIFGSFGGPFREYELG